MNVRRHRWRRKRQAIKQARSCSVSTSVIASYRLCGAAICESAVCALRGRAGSGLMVPVKQR